MSNDICPKCGCAPIPGCNGTGYFRIDNTTVRLCRNMYVKQLAQHLGKNIAAAKHVVQSPLYKASTKKGEPPIVDRTKESLVIRTPSWEELLPHLKWALGCKGLDFRFKILDDLDVVNVKVGATSRTSKGVSRREDGDGVYNHLGELASDYDLVILRLGYMGYKNKAAPGALLEFLLIQESHRKSIWVVIDGEHPWDTMSAEAGDEPHYGYSYSQEVDSYMTRCFDEVELGSTGKAPVKAPVKRTNHIVVDEEEAYFPPETPKPVKATINATAPEVGMEGSVNLDLDNILPGNNSPKKKNWRKR